ncbi:hypothetical protein ACQPZU_01050 [Saccharomonospora azurea]|uniref:hypothetical protein n=1 Tax=Saccharomonospora azurea TaxID=40988 RepID=UPI003D94920D
MPDGYPQLQVERDVVVVHGEQHHQARLRSWLDSHDGPMPTYRIELLTRLGLYGGPYTATGPDMFEALVRLRRQLEPEGLMIAVQGARRDTFPSGMARDMGEGKQVYVLRPGQPANRDDLVETLADAPLAQLATVDEQRAFFETWRNQSAKSRPNAR